VTRSNINHQRGDEWWRHAPAGNGGAESAHGGGMTGGLLEIRKNGLALTVHDVKYNNTERW
jgi:hypothetical protein